jgi:hypothetical protein
MLGPLHNCIFDVRIGGYLRGSPTPADGQCLVAFFTQLLTPSAVACKHRSLGRSYLISICNHLILVKPRIVGGFLIANIKPVNGKWYI